MNVLCLFVALGWSDLGIASSPLPIVGSPSLESVLGKRTAEDAGLPESTLPLLRRRVLPRESATDAGVTKANGHADNEPKVDA